MAIQRLPRFRRAEELISSFQITARDLEILKMLHRFRFLRSTHIRELSTGSGQQILRRLQLLFHHGYIDRPTAQLDYFQTARGKSIVYSLSPKGYGFLKRTLNLPFKEFDSTSRNSEVGRFFLEHALMTSDILTRTQKFANQIEGLQLLHGDQITLPQKTKDFAVPFQWRVEVSSRLIVGVVPDAVFALVDREGADNPAFFFVEADRGTMPVSRSSLSKSSFFRKLLAYEATWTQNIHKKRFGVHRFRVLTVTSSKERAEHLNEAAKSLNRGKGLFIFTDIETFLSNPFGPICSTPDEESRVPFFTNHPSVTSAQSK